MSFATVRQSKSRQLKETIRPRESTNQPNQFFIMSDFYETNLIAYENKLDLLHDKWNKKYYAYVEAFKNRLREEKDVIYNDWVDTLDELLELVNSHHKDGLKVRIRRFITPEEDPNFWYAEPQHQI